MRCKFGLGWLTAAVVGLSAAGAAADDCPVFGVRIDQEGGDVYFDMTPDQTWYVCNVSDGTSCQIKVSLGTAALLSGKKLRFQHNTCDSVVGRAQVGYFTLVNVK